jgi:chorismate-pyruvate lyase
MPNSISQLTDLFFPAIAELGEFQAVDASELPEAYQSLLAHSDHMTVTVEAWHNSLVDLRVLAERSLPATEQDGDSYARKILLALQRDGSPAQFGIMRINLAGLPEIVRLEIESQALPLGRIMIRHHLMRAVELCQLWRVKPGPELRLQLQLEDDEPIYGRTARISVDGRPAVELLEIVRT